MVWLMAIFQYKANYSAALSVERIQMGAHEWMVSISLNSDQAPVLLLLLSALR